MDLQGLKILLVDDEELLREVVAMMIEDNGAEVICASDGKEGVELFKSEHVNLSLVLMDFSMPAMNGYEAFCEMQSINPSVPVILVSGLDLTPEAGKLRAENKIGFMSKPFHETDLVSAIKNRCSR